MSVFIQRYLPFLSGSCCPESRSVVQVNPLPGEASREIVLGEDRWSSIVSTCRVRNENGEFVTRTDNGILDHLTGDVYKDVDPGSVRGVACSLGVMPGLVLFVGLGVFMKLLFILPRILVTWLEGIDEIGKAQEVPDKIVLALLYFLVWPLYKTLLTLLLCVLAPLFFLALEATALYTLMSCTASGVMKGRRTLAHLQMAFLGGAQRKDDLRGLSPASWRDFFERSCFFIAYCCLPLGNLHQMRDSRPKYGPVQVRFAIA